MRFNTPQNQYFTQLVCDENKIGMDWLKWFLFARNSERKERTEIHFLLTNVSLLFWFGGVTSFILSHLRSKSHTKKNQISLFR